MKEHGSFTAEHDCSTYRQHSGDAFSVALAQYDTLAIPNLENIQTLSLGASLRCPHHSSQSPVKNTSLGLQSLYRPLPETFLDSYQYSTNHIQAMRAQEEGKVSLC